MIYSTSCGGKTFVAGEYGALLSGSALLLVSEPCFAAEFYCAGDARVAKPVSKHCQAFVNSKPALSDISCKFYDPYGGRGGLGASSAEFLFWLRLNAFLSQHSYDFCVPSHRRQALDYYFNSVWNKSGSKPSGLDLVAQNYSGFVFIDLPANEVTKIAWPFPDVAFSIVHTGYKVATHLHLSSLAVNEDMRDLSVFGKDAKDSLMSGNLISFLKVIKDNANVLKKMSLTIANTQNILSCINSSGLFLAAKGCGALGADVILCFYNKKNQEKVSLFFQQQSLQVLTCSK